MKPDEDPPVVESVRRARRELLREFDYDLSKYIAFLQDREKAAGRKMSSPRSKARR
jgi:hypothetical protein